GIMSMSRMGCSAPPGYVVVAGDCDDTTIAVHPGVTDTCNGIDDDCDGVADPGCMCMTGMMRMCGPSDGMGGFLMVGACHPGTQVCGTGAWGTCTGSVSPSSESCNGVDDNCDGTVDEGVQLTFYRDMDGDGYGATSVTTMACSPPPGYVLLSG